MYIYKWDIYIYPSCRHNLQFDYIYCFFYYYSEVNINLLMMLFQFICNIRKSKPTIIANKNFIIFKL